MEEKKKEGKIGEALLKVALGYQVAEVTEEYAEVDGELKLTKRKKTKKDVPPDLRAVQMLLENKENSLGFADLSDEELEKERERLLGILQEQKTVEKVKKTAKNVGRCALKEKKPRPKPRKRVVRKKAEKT